MQESRNLTKEKGHLVAWKRSLIELMKAVLGVCGSG